jgi:two-component system, sensor histidine kinase
VTTAAASAHTEAEVDLVCLRMTYDALQMRVVVTTVAAAATAWVLASEIDPRRLLGWFAVIAALGTCRLALARFIKARPGSDDTLRRFEPLMSALTLLPAAAWGALILVCGLSTSTLVVSTILLAIGGMTASGTANAAPAPRLFRVSIALSLMPMVLHLLTTGQSSHRAIVVMVFGYVVGVLGALDNTNRELRQSIALRFTNEDLLQRLVAEKERERAARKDADDANREKSRFVAAASHDVRQPLHALGLFVDGLKSQPLEAPARKLVSSIEQAHASLVAVHEGLLDISMLDSGGVTPKVRSVRLGPLFEAIVTEARPAAHGKGLELSAKGVDATIETDPDLVMRVLRNLVANAVTYTQRGRVLLTARQRAGAVLVQVWDSGIGIPADQLDLVFRELHQVANASRQREKGLGLGLAIVERLARLLGFSVSVRSELGRGSVFSFTLPLAHTVATAEPVPVRPARPSLRAPAGAIALVIDDDALARAALGSVLGGWGYEVVAATSAEEAQEYLVELERVDVLISDMALPGRSGLELLVGFDRPATKRVLISGDTSPTLADRARAAGLDFVRKPVRAEVLESMLAGP